MARTRSDRVGPASRPVAIPTDVDDPAVRKASGRVQLPHNVRWSDPLVTYDMSRREDRARVYEQVMREGTDEDVRHFVDVDQIVEMWDELVLPPYVRRAWAQWFRERRQLELAC